ncbi:D-glycero-alpha-D-manno-heptose-1,7-bisphosphate 7-phosphatase [Planctomycetota bacterium]
MTAGRHRGVFLDRDGVLNRPVIKDGRPYPPGDVSQLELLPGVVEGLSRLKEAGFLLIVATNQPDVSRGTQKREVVEAIHERLRCSLPLDEIFVCYGGSDEDPRRKPNPGMLLEAADRFDVGLCDSFMIGDRWRDVEAGHRAGCRTVFLDYGYKERSPEPPATFSTGLFGEAVRWILHATVHPLES